MTNILLIWIVFVESERKNIDANNYFQYLISQSYMFISFSMMKKSSNVNELFGTGGVRNEWRSRSRCHIPMVYAQPFQLEGYCRAYLWNNWTDFHRSKLYELFCTCSLWNAAVTYLSTPLWVERVGVSGVLAVWFRNGVGKVTVLGHDGILYNGVVNLDKEYPLRFISGQQLKRRHLVSHDIFNWPLKIYTE